MREEVRRDNYIEVTGIVIRNSHVGEYDRRVVLLTKERGKISAFARGARRQGNALMGVTALFCFGKFRLYAGRDSYVLTEALIDHYFESLSTSVEKACYGSYFLEVMDYLTRENNDETILLLLTYAALRSLERDILDHRLIRCIFEIRTVMAEGEFPGIPEGKWAEGTLYAIQRIAAAPVSELFSFKVSENILEELQYIAAKLCRESFRHSFSSLEILETLCGSISRE